jgi:hypothetical protein
MAHLSCLAHLAEMVHSHFQHQALKAARARLGARRRWAAAQLEADSARQAWERRQDDFRAGLPHQLWDRANATWGSALLPWEIGAFGQLVSMLKPDRKVFKPDCKAFIYWVSITWSVETRPGSVISQYQFSQFSFPEIIHNAAETTSSMGRVAARGYTAAGTLPHQLCFSTQLNPAPICIAHS